jgi:hypothetical protein
MPKKTIPEMTDKELEREALEGLNTQQTDLEKAANGWNKFYNVKRER